MRWSPRACCCSSARTKCCRIPSADVGALAALGIIFGALYATGLALGAESLARTSFWLLYAEEDRYRLLARNMTDVISRHGKNGAVLFVSPAAEKLFGVSEWLHGHGLFDRVHVGDRPAYLTALADAAAHGEERSVEFRVRREPSEAGGPAMPQFIWVEMRCRPLDSAASETAGVREVVAVMRDVTPRKTQEQAIEEARAEAERAHAAKSKFLANMSHELRTPLNAIIGFSEMLMNEEKMRIGAERRAEYAQLINDFGTHLLSVVNGILDMSKMETGDFAISPEPFAADKVVVNCCDMLALKARESGLDLVTRLDAGPAGDRRRQARVQADIDQPALQRREVHRPRRPCHGNRRGGCHRALRRRRGHRRRHQQPPICRRSAIHSFRRAPPMIASMTAPVSGFRSSRVW